MDGADIAAVAVRALLDDRAPNSDLIITGPTPVSYAQVARITADHGGNAPGF